MTSSGFFGPLDPFGLFLGFFGLGGAVPGDFEEDLVLLAGGSPGSGSPEPPLDLDLLGMLSFTYFH